MAKTTDIRPKITLACTVCKDRNYITKKNRRNDPDRLELEEVLPALPHPHAAPRDPLTVTPSDRRPPRAGGFVVVGLAHGSRHQGMRPAIDTLLAEVARRGGVATRAAYLDLADPDLSTVAAALPPAGVAVVVPLLFTRAFHARVDVPATVTAAASAATGIELILGDILGTGDDVLDLLQAAARDAGIADDQPMLLYAVGSADPAANEAVHDLAGRLGGRRVGPVSAGFGTAEPTGRSVLDRLAGVAAPAILPLFVAPGLLLDPMVALAAERGWTLAPPLGARLAPVVLARAQDARAAAGQVG